MRFFAKAKNLFSLVKLKKLLKHKFYLHYSFRFINKHKTMGTTITYKVDHPTNDHLNNSSLSSNLNLNSHLPLPSLSHSHPPLPTFLSHNGFKFPDIEISDIEMTTIKKLTYTSLKDLLPASPSSVMSPTHNSSWNEIPIKNPLVKQAALAYLQPMSTPLEVGDKGFFGKLKDKYCSCGGFGCFGWFSVVVSRTFEDVFGDLCGSRRRRIENGEDEDDDDDDDDDDDEDEDDDKVD